MADYHRRANDMSSGYARIIQLCYELRGGEEWNISLAISPGPLTVLA
jgi:hypothetical protein